MPKTIYRNICWGSYNEQKLCICILAFITYTRKHDLEPQQYVTIRHMTIKVFLDNMNCMKLVREAAKNLPEAESREKSCVIRYGN